MQICYIDDYLGQMIIWGSNSVQIYAEKFVSLKLFSLKYFEILEVVKLVDLGMESA